MRDTLIQETPRGLYCPQGDFYIDPHHAVKRAVITHAHSDHARHGHKLYLTHHLTAPILKHRLGSVTVHSVEYGEKINLNGVQISLHPAGHILGSAQVRLEYQGEVWVVSGDYKLENDGLTTPFEPVQCHVFLTESTFGLPVYRWPDQKHTFEDLNAWWRRNQAQGKLSLVLGYSLGKAQRIVKNLDFNIGKIYAHSAVWHINQRFREAGVDLPFVEKFDGAKLPEDLSQSLLIATSSVLNSAWLHNLENYATASCSGWMQVHSARRRNGVDKPVILSDHADWPSLNKAVEMSGAERIYVMHGFEETLARWLREKGYNASEIHALRLDSSHLSLEGSV